MGAASAAFWDYSRQAAFISLTSSRRRTMQEPIRHTSSSATRLIVLLSCVALVTCGAACTSGPGARAASRTPSPLRSLSPDAVSERRFPREPVRRARCVRRRGAYVHAHRTRRPMTAHETLPGLPIPGGDHPAGSWRTCSATGSSQALPLPLLLPLSASLTRMVRMLCCSCV